MPTRRTSGLAASIFFLSFVPWVGLALSLIVPWFVPVTWREATITIAIANWLGSTTSAGFVAFVASGVLLTALFRQRHVRGRLLSFLALTSSSTALLLGITPIVLAVVLVVAGVAALASFFLAIITTSAPMGRPLGPAATGSHLLLAHRRRIWAARAVDEARSVHAFEALLPVLEAHDAPEPLLQRVRHAAEDEARHAVLAATLAGVPLPEPTAVAKPPADPASTDALVALVHESYVDGCIGEAFAAAVLRAESQRTGRAETAAIARDEAEHATLAWDLVAWGLGRPDVADAFDDRPQTSPRTMLTPSRDVFWWSQRCLHRAVRAQAESDWRRLRA